MRTKFIMPCLLAASLMLGACNENSAPAPAKPAVAVVDVTRALRDSDAGKAGMKFLEDIQKELQGEIAGLQDKMKDDAKADPKDQKAQKLVQQHQQELQAVFMALQQRMQAEQQNVISRLNDMFQRVLEAQRAAKGLTVILPTESVALAYDKSADVTDAVIAAMNKEKVDFVSIAPKADKPAAEAAAPAEKADKPAAAPADAPKADAPKADKPADKK